MNSRIKELAEQAGSTHKQNLGVYQFYTDELEKFAELIIRTCIAKCDDLNSMKYIANHFGIHIEGLNSVDSSLENNWDHYSGLPAPNAYRDN